MALLWKRKSKRGAAGSPDESPWNVRVHAELSAPGLRSSYEVDRDRIVHSSTFRELQHKTQVQSVVHLSSDIDINFRTRLNHVIEVAQLARSLAREVAANEPLAEAIALGHDLGHPPFGHAGERALREALVDHGRAGWNANVHSLAVVDEIEVAFTRFRGLNLTWATREGIARHSTPFDEPISTGEFVSTRFGGIECQIVDAADVLAYIAHDLDDALTGSFISEPDIAELSPMLADLAEGANSEWEEGGRVIWPESERAAVFQRRIIAKLVSRMIKDLSQTTLVRLREGGIGSPTGVRDSSDRVVAHSVEFGELVQRLLGLLTSKYYRSEVVQAADERAVLVVRQLFDALVRTPRLIPERFLSSEADPVVSAATYVASLNDRSATKLAGQLSPA